MTFDRSVKSLLLLGLALGMFSIANTFLGHPLAHATWTGYVALTFITLSGASLSMKGEVYATRPNGK
jgi:hypothetical protein